jgi:small conductance mechanosensitive channel
MDNVQHQFQTWIETSGIHVITLIAVGIGLTIILRWFIRPGLFRGIEVTDEIEAEERRKRGLTLALVVRKTGSIVVWIVIILLMIKEMGIDIAPFVASAGIAGIAIGLGAQSIVKDVIAGFFILTENHFNQGDVIRVGTVSGRVEAINLRTTILRDLEGTVHIIPNGQITIVSNMTKQWSQVVLDVPLSVGEDIDQAIDLIQHVLDDLSKNKQFKQAILEKPKVLGVEQIDTTTVTIRALVKTKPEQRWAVDRVLKRKIRQEFDKRGIKDQGIT